jgi:thiol-disulfide isomerase/thioredoxin
MQKYNPKYKTIDTLKPDQANQTNQTNQANQANQPNQPNQANNQPNQLEQSRLMREMYINGNSIVCVYLSAKWCEPCKITSPLFDNLAQIYNKPSVCMLIKEDVSNGCNNRDYNVNAIPAFIFYKNGKILIHPNGKPFDVVGGNIKEVEKVLTELLP